MRPHVIWPWKLVAYKQKRGLHMRVADFRRPWLFSEKKLLKTFRNRAIQHDRFEVWWLSYLKETSNGTDPVFFYTNLLKKFWVKVLFSVNVIQIYILEYACLGVRKQRLTNYDLNPVRIQDSKKLRRFILLWRLKILAECHYTIFRASGDQGPPYFFLGPSGALFKTRRG